MTATMMTPSRFGASVTGNFTTQYSNAAPSMADSLPSVDFGFNDLRERMAQFTARFDDFIEKGRKRVLEERNAFKINIAEISETQRHRRQAIQSLESKTSTHASTIAKEMAETNEMHEAIHAFKQQKEEAIARRDGLREEIAALQAQIKQRRDAQAAYQRSLDAQARHNIPELRFWEQCLGLRIEGTGVADQLRFVYLAMDERDPERTCHFELWMGGREYEIVESEPRLDVEDMQVLQGRLNESRELGAFLKGMRCMFMAVLKG
ncbi:kinetochore protein-like protein spc25 [Acrodontium crateriforme]|uniref:Kinetochore protein SPC25 n=1 Tax=Acrodontium crateriforme TaxID=150365 RepID=A0AAQ3R8K9_9PEZI|nr:kinetochore protein-like protein spc25 [Acrodontium crateriforme]